MDLTGVHAPANNSDSNDEDDDDEDDDDDDDGFNCDNALVEYARSGRSSCIHCRGIIANRAIRVGVLQHNEAYEDSMRFMHLACVRSFNSHRYDRASKVRATSLQGLGSFSAVEQRQIRAAIQ